MYDSYSRRSSIHFQKTPNQEKKPESLISPPNANHSAQVLRIFHICNLLNAFLLSLPPQNLRHHLPSCWFPDINLHRNEPLAIAKTTTTTTCRSTDVKMDVTELKRFFQMFDRNGDCRISKQELNDSPENMGIVIPHRQLFSMIEKIDVNGDGCLDIDEFSELYQSIMDTRDEEEDMKEAFNVFYQNGDDFITVDELRSVLSSLGLKKGRSMDDCKRMIMKIDVDGNGRVDYHEFKQMMKGEGFMAL